MTLRSQPPLELVQLSDVREQLWAGIPVFHPHYQVGNTPRWLSDSDEDFGDAAYDVGVVFEWGPDPDFADIGIVRVAFVGDGGSVLRYASTNLWVPKTLCERIQGAGAERQKEQSSE